MSIANTALEDTAIDQNSKNQANSQATSDVYLPYSDELMAAAGRIWLFYVEELGDALIKCAKRALEARKISVRAAAISVANFNWKGKDGKSIKTLPFEVRFSGDFPSESN